MPNLTKKYIDQLKHVGSREVVHWDDEVRGFGVRVWPSGKKVYIVKYRNQLRQQRKFTIGDASTMSVQLARIRAKMVLAHVRVGDDPAGALAEARGAPAVTDVANRYMKEHAYAKKKARSAEGDETLLRLHILPRLGAMRITKVRREDISRLHHQLRDRPGAANRTISLLSKIFNLCEFWGLRPDGTNPCRHVQKYRERKVERYLSDVELGRLGSVLAHVEFSGTELPSVVPAIRLLLLTGCRLSEILTLRWSEVDLDAHQIKLSDSKTGAKIVYLAPAVTDLLRSLVPLQGNPFVIPGEKPGSHLVNLRKPWYRIRAKAELNDVRIHDLRHTFASVAAADGHSLPVIGALLGHTQPQTTQRYAHLAANPMQAAVTSTASRLLKSLSSPLPGR